MNNKLEGICAVRDGIEDDFNFVLATSLRGLYYGNSWFNLIPKDVFMVTYKNLLTRLLISDGVALKVACLIEDPTVIVGYSILSADFQVIHYVYVKSKWRKAGVARALLPQYPSAVTHLTDLGRELMPKFKDCVFNPFIL